MPENTIGPEPTLPPLGPEERETLPPGYRLGQYEIARLLGRGGLVAGRTRVRFGERPPPVPFGE